MKKLFLLVLFLFLGNCAENNHDINQNSDITCYISFYIHEQKREEIYPLEFEEGKRDKFIEGYNNYAKDARESLEFHQKLAKENNGIPIIVSNPPILERYQFCLTFSEKKNKHICDAITDKFILCNNDAFFNIYDYFTKESWERVFIRDYELRRLKELEYAKED